MTDATPRWRYRFDNYHRAFVLLREAIELAEERPLSPLEQEGVIQRFEYTWELAWKVMKDYLDYQGVSLTSVTPRATIRAAFAAQVITDGDLWMQALDARNRMAHTYSRKAFEAAIAEIKSTYLGLFDQLHFFLMEQRADGV